MAEEKRGRQQKPPSNLPSSEDEGQDLRRSDETDIADVAENQMPGTPPNVTIHPRDPHEEARRREFERMVEEREKKDKN
jgi:hypothetical protein